MPTIALDAMGCDRGPEVTLEGAAALSREEGAPEHNPNEVYHVSLNLTHVHRVN